MTADLDRRLAESDDLVQLLRDRDDLVTTPRRVTFEFSLRGRQMPYALLSDARKAGYEVESCRQPLLRGTRVVLSRPTAVDEPAAAAFTRVLVELADRHGAQFDMWLPEPVIKERPGR